MDTPRPQRYLYVMAQRRHFPPILFMSTNYWVDVNFSGTGGPDGPWLDSVVLNNSTVNVYGNTTVNVNTNLRLHTS